VPISEIRGDMNKVIAISFLLVCSLPSIAQNPIESQTGAWYMYFFSKRFGESRFGVQGDYQYRSWNFGSDLEQLMLRTGATYRPKNAEITFTLGYAYVLSGGFGDSDITVYENRIYQEALFPQKIGTRFLLTHRFRYEQRWLENQDFRTRYRYNLFVNVPLNNTKLEKKTVYVALYNELFINGQKGIGHGLSVELFDRNRTYLGMGYGLRDNLRLQAGWMYQLTNLWGKGQVQLSLHHSF